MKYHINRYTWGSMPDFLDFLGGKKFIYHRLSIGGYGNELASLNEFTKLILPSPDVIEVKLAAFNTEDLIYVLDLMEKLPNCRGIALSQFTITEHTAPCLAKIMKLPQVRAMPVRYATITPEACQALADSMDPDRFLVLSLEECNIPTTVPIINALVNANINTIPYILDRPLNDDESAAMVNLVKNNKHITTLRLGLLSSKSSREFAESLKTNKSVTTVTFSRCDLVTAIPAITEVLCASDTIASCNLNICNISLALLTELCEGLKHRKSTTDLTLIIADRNYNDSLEPIAKLLENNIQLPGLSITASSNTQEWISVINALKKNTTLKRLSVTIPEPNDQIIGEITNALKVNNTLRLLHVDVYLFVPVLDQLVSEVVSQNKLESFRISHGILKDLDFATLCNMLKKNRKLKRFSPGNELSHDASEQSRKLFTEMMEENCFLVQCDMIEDYFTVIKPYAERNKQYEKEWTEVKQNMIVLIHNMARNAETIRKLLPIENWIEIFKQFHHPQSPINGLESIAKAIFKRYALY